ncbi:MAG: ABC transporter ATP-binding protein [Anaerolineaceae bacterium]|nr:ABC transporter ATP-binding protein [Anaerolineaceae bacterium]
MYGKALNPTQKTQTSSAVGVKSASALGRAIGYLGHYKQLAFWAYLFLFISTGAMLTVPQLIQNIIDAVSNGYIAKQISAIPAAFLPTVLQKLGWTADQFTTYQNGAEQALISAGLLILMFAIMRGAFAYAQTYMSERVSQSVAFDFRNDLFSKIQRLSFTYHDRNQTGQLMVRATDDVEKLRLFIGQGLLMATQALVMLIGSMLILVFTNLKLTLVILPILPIAIVLFVVFGMATRPLFTEVQIRLSRLNTILQENLAGMKVIKAFVREPEQQRRFDKSADDLMTQQIKVARFFSFLFPLIFLVIGLGQAAIQYFGGRQIIEGTLTLGEWQKFSMYLMYVFFPLGQLGMIISQMSQASASATRVFEILDARNDVVDKPDAITLPNIQGKVEFRNVTFNYFGGGTPALKDVSFTADPGQTIALLGATGSGKSTIINLIPRFYDATSGQVLIDGYNVRDVCLDSLRRQIGIVLQDTTLFSGSIRDNIAFGRPDASQEDVTAAAKAASAHDFIMEFPRGYDTPVGERGATLSGGQKQRIAIARALLMDPRILILDDSTSSVDTVTEYEIQQTLTHLMQGRTSFVIAQRISTVRNADRILILDRGEVVASGRHEDLMEESAIYAEIYNSQLVEDAPGQLQAGAVPELKSEEN